jgi:hypothetical protein
MGSDQPTLVRAAVVDGLAPAKRLLDSKFELEERLGGGGMGMWCQSSPNSSQSDQARRNGAVDDELMQMNVGRPHTCL